jgi:nicotinamidase/pyrazinamidase
MKTLVLVDIQYDFLPGGALAVAHGDEVVAVANRLIPSFPLIVATQDWHPADHGSFASNHPGKKPGDVIELGGMPQVLWPPHCVQGTHGAELVQELHRERIRKVFRKGTDPGIDSYSGFYDNGHSKSTGMGEWLKGMGANSLYIMGLATDYCVKATALDARALGFAAAVVEDGCRAVELEPGDGERAFAEMAAAKVRRIPSMEMAC